MRLPALPGLHVQHGKRRTLPPIMAMTQLITYPQVTHSVQRVIAAGYFAPAMATAFFQPAASSGCRRKTS